MYHFQIALVFLVTSSYIAESIMKLIIPSDTKRQSPIQKCLVDIVEDSVNPKGIVVEVASKEFVPHIPIPKILFNPYVESSVTISHLLPDAYIIETTGADDLDCLLYKLVRTRFWNPRAKFVINHKGNSAEAKKLFGILLTYHILNVVAVIKETLSKINLYTYFPYTNTNSVTPVLIGSCEGNLTALFQSKLPHNWKNFTLRTALKRYPPFTFSSNSTYKGFELNVLEMLEDKLHFKVQYINKTITEWGKMHINGTWDGFYGIIQNNEADLGIGGFYANYDSNWYFDKSVVYQEDEAVWVVPAARKVQNWQSIIKIFDWKVWLLLLQSTVCTSLIVCFIGMILNYSRIEKYTFLNAALSGKIRHYIENACS